MLVQMSIDLWIGFGSDSRAEMKELSSQVLSVPVLDVAFYGFVPALYMFGLVALAIHLAIVRATPVWSAVLVTLGGVLIGTRITALGVEHARTC